MKWNLVQKHEDVIYEKSGTGMAKITINRPEVRNAFRPQTLFELQKCFEDVREDLLQPSDEPELTGVAADKIDQLTIKPESGDRTTVQKQSGSWQLTQENRPPLSRKYFLRVTFSRSSSAITISPSRACLRSSTIT